MNLPAVSPTEYEYRLLITGARIWGVRPDGYEEFTPDVQAAIDERVAREQATIEVAIRECVFATAGQGHYVKLAHGAARGADSYADEVARQLRVEPVSFQAEWDRYGRAAGMKRNVRMLDEFKPHVVFAFSADLAMSRGTAGCVREAIKRYVPVYHFDGRHEAKRLLQI